MIRDFPADWSLGKASGYIRNKAMSEFADACICFWNGKSKGTKYMIDLATAQGIALRIVRY